MVRALMDQNQLNNLRNIAQGLHNIEASRIARETAAATESLLRSQEQQRALEQQKLQIEQIRLQEERERNRIIEARGQRQRAIRNTMAELEGKIMAFSKDLAAGRFNQTVAGAPIASFLGLLFQRQLQLIASLKEELDDLSDIRFVASLQRSFDDLVSVHHEPLSGDALDLALTRLIDLAGWTGGLKTQHTLVQSEVQKLLISSAEWSSDAKIQSGLKSVESYRQELEQIWAELQRRWSATSGDLKTLERTGIGSEEIAFVTEGQTDRALPELGAEISQTLENLEQARNRLKSRHDQWASDKATVEQGRQHCAAGRWADAERTLQDICAPNFWTDFDSLEVQKALDAEGSRVWKEISVIAAPKKRASLLERRIQEYAASPWISGFFERLLKQERELIQRAHKRIITRALGVAVVVLSILGGEVLMKIFNRANAERAEKAEKERIAAAKEAESARIAYEQRATVRREAVAAGKLLLDQDGRALLLVPGGKFEMGPDDKNTVHTVEVSSFFMAETETTLGEWRSVSEWAKAHGYDIIRGDGRGDKHPVTDISWTDVLKWCNAKSEKEELKPCYTVGGNIYRNGYESEVLCDWSASGYRLPTEAQWEKAARGGLVGKQFPNGDVLEEKDANFKVGHAVEVGKYPANGYGLHDMAGNVCEWCWDQRGYYRVIRDGSGYYAANDCSVAKRDTRLPGTRVHILGFRIARVPSR